MTFPAVGIIGAGVVGSAVAMVLKQKGVSIVGVADLDPQKQTALAQKLSVAALSPEEVAQQAKILFLTTNDGNIELLTRNLAEKQSFQPGQLVLHMSGALTSEILAPAAQQGAICLSVHPLQAFATAEQAVSVLPGSVFSLEGDSSGYALGLELVEILEGKPFFIDKEAKTLYHAGACVVSNYLVTLIDLGTQLLKAAGIPGEQALPALFPLIEGTLRNIQQVGSPQALTGPIARGDTATIAQHLQAIEEKAPDLRDLYCDLGRQTIHVARRKKSISPETSTELERILNKCT